jgi:hypothetical protein
VDLNLDTLKREILAYLEDSGFVIFRSHPGGLEGLSMVTWDSEGYPDYQMFLSAAKQVGVKLILFASRDFDFSEIEEALEQLPECDLSHDERRDFERRLKALRVHEGAICSIELAFDHHSRLYVYELQPDWYEEFVNISDEITLNMPMDEDADEDSLGNFYSNN